MEGEARVEALRCVALDAAVEVGVQQRTVLGMCATLDDLAGTLHRRLAAQVGHTVLRDDHLHRVLAVIHVRHHRYERADLAILRRRRRGEDRDVARARKVARSADAVHHLRAQYVRRVDVAEDVGLQCGVDRDHSESAHHLGVVRDLLRTEQQLVLEEVQTGVDLAQRLMTYAQRATAGERHATLIHELDHGVLNHLRVDREGRDGLVFTHATEHRVGYVAHATLQRQERLRQTARLHLAHEEVRHVAADGQRDVV